MGSSGGGARPTGLRLERETLRDLAPSPADAAAVRGGDSSTCLRKEGCVAIPAAFDLLGRTTMSWGCAGTIRIINTDEGQEIHLDLRPNDATLELHETIKRAFDR